MTSQETIAHLDELRAQALQENGRVSFEADVYEIPDDRAVYICALNSSYDQLRKAALAGAELAEAVGEMGQPPAEKEDRAFVPPPILYAIEQYNASWEAQRDAALDTYKKSV